MHALSNPEPEGKNWTGINDDLPIAIGNIDESKSYSKSTLPSAVCNIPDHKKKSKMMPEIQITVYRDDS